MKTYRERSNSPGSSWCFLTRETLNGKTTAAGCSTALSGMPPIVSETALYRKRKSTSFQPHGGKRMESATVQGLIDFAIGEERSAFSLYTELAQRLSDQGSKTMLRDMAAMEKGHEQKLLDLKKGVVEKLETVPVPDLKIGDFLIDVKVTPESSIQEVLVFAIKSEMKANKLYTELSGKMESTEAKKLLLALASEEQKHKNDLERAYDDMINREN